MTPNHILFLKSLDPDGVYGTIQNVLLSQDLSKAPFEGAARYLLTCMMDERKVLMQENKRMRDALVKAGLYTSELMQLEG